jgi:hypothetical protein
MSLSRFYHPFSGGDGTTLTPGGGGGSSSVSPKSVGVKPTTCCKQDTVFLSVVWRGGGGEHARTYVV